MLNQNFVFESVNIQEIDGVRTEVVTRDYQMFYFLAISLLAKALWVYGNALWLLPQWVKDRQTPGYLLKLLLLLGISLVVEMGLIHLYANFIPQEQRAINYFLAMWQLNALFYLFYYGASVAYILGKKWWVNEQVKKQLQQENLVNELNFLKSQVNPHFLFNTLNNLYTIAERQQNQELAGGIADLSNMMRYMLYDCRADRVPLVKEITLLQSMVDMQQLRMEEEDQLLIRFDIEGDYEGKEIAPLILVPFVENAFKHGINWKADSWVKILFRVEGETLRFSVKNTLFPSADGSFQTQSGIGLENVKRRLELIYGSEYNLDIQKGETEFSIELIINLTL